MAGGNYHEPYEELSPAARDLHRAVNSLIEELEAIDWYSQRAEVCTDDELRAVLIHNRDEEVEHAMMTLEWLRRMDPVIDRMARQYLFTSGSITEKEEEETGKAQDERRQPIMPRRDGSLGIGALRKEAP